MLRAPIPEDEQKRLELLRACNIIYTPSEAAFDDIARLAADICGTEIALITLVDADRQWFKARVGVEQTGTARDLSFCGHCINDRHPLVVDDTHADTRFADNPLVTGDPHIRFYAGVPLLVEAGSAVGAISVADRAPKRLSERQLASLVRLAAQVSRELGLRRDLEQVRASLRPVASEIPIGPGSVIGGRWRVERRLGRGAVGAVFEARDATGERVAIKVLLPEWRAQEQVLERFAREARVLMRLKTPHVGHLIDVGNLDADSGDLPFLVLEYLEGMDLDHVLSTVGRVPFKKAFNWGADACKGVAEAHELGVVHRDIKPSNVFLARTPEVAGQVKVLDFGIAAGEPARRGGSQLTAVESLLGTPAYMSPEQMISSSEVDPRSDIWSMGVLLYQLVTGKLPFPGESNLEMFAAAMTRPPVPLEEQLPDRLPPAVESILYTCLKKDRNERFPSMNALSSALHAATAA
ncbi:MAG TPA: protein kinase [Polyangiaceae bacterium]|nr:protein kinase [Polyangiaceae bacterium]